MLRLVNEIGINGYLSCMSTEQSQAAIASREERTLNAMRKAHQFLAVLNGDERASMALLIRAAAI